MDHVQNAVLAAEMKDFFQQCINRMPVSKNMSETVALEYARFLWGTGNRKGLAQRGQEDNSKYDVALAHSQVDMQQLTMRVSLISDTLMLSQHNPGHSREILSKASEVTINDAVITKVGFRYSNLDAIGRWILEAEPLLKSGLAWYLPHFWETNSRSSAYYEGSRDYDSKVPIVDFLIQGKNRLIHSSDADPIKSKIVRPIMEIDLPFLDGVNLRDFSDITVSEFNSYINFRDFLRDRFLSIDDSMNAVESERALMRIGIEIRDQVRATRSEMSATVRKRAVASSGAMVGSVGTILAAVYGPAFEEALKILGVGAGLWGVMESLSTSNIKQLKDDKWYYVWALYKKRGRGVI